MRFIKLIGISFVAFFLLLTAFTSLIPSEIRISRAVDIQAGKEMVLPLLKEDKKWNRWIQDSTRVIRIHPIITNDSLIRAEWTAGNKTFNSSYALYEVKEGTVTVQWYFDMKLSWYPWDKLGSIVYDKQMGPVMEESLGKLKQLVESNP